MTPPEIPIRSSSKRSAEDYEEDLQTLKVEKRRIRRVQSKLSMYFDSKIWWETEREYLEKEEDEQQLKFEKKLLELKEQGCSPDSKEIKDLRRKHDDAVDESDQKQRKADTILRELAEQAHKGIHQLAKDGFNSTNAFVESLMIAYSQGGQGPRSSWEQTQLRRDCIDVYGSQEPGGDKLWCPITRAFLPPDQMCAAHIFPQKLGTKTMHLIFGKSDPNEIMSPRNCLMIARALEQRFDKHNLVIVPIETEPGKPSRWKVRVLNAGDGNKSVPGLNLSMNALDNRELVFLTPYRPASRYLYYHFVMSVFFAQKGQEKGWVKRITSRENKFWATPGKYLRKSMLKHIAQQIGHQIDAQLEEDEIDAIPNTFEEPNESVASEVEASHQVGLRHMKKRLNLERKEDSNGD